MAKVKQLESVHKKIGEYDFYIKRFPAMKSANLSGELASMVAPIFASLAAVLKDDKKNETANNGLMDINLESAAPAIGKAFEGLSGDAIEVLLRKLLIKEKNIAVEYLDEEDETIQEILTESLVNEIFCGEVQDMYILAFEVIRLNFNGFFKKVGSLSGSAKSLEKVVRPMF